MAENKLSGFTLVPDALVEEYGLIRAVVYGVVRRYCLMANSQCEASKETLAKKIGVSVKTIERHLNSLEKDGYITDKTPDVRNIPHIYKTTGKAERENAELAKQGTTNRGTSQSRTNKFGGASQSLNRYVTKSHEDTIKDKERDKKFSFFEELVSKIEVHLEKELSILEKNLLLSDMEIHTSEEILDAAKHLSQKADTYNYISEVMKNKRKKKEKQNLESLRTEREIAAIEAYRHQNGFSPFEGDTFEFQNEIFQF